MSEKFGKFLQSLIDARGLTRADVARAIGVSKAAVGKNIAGADPQPDTLEKYADFFGFPSGVDMKMVAHSRKPGERPMANAPHRSARRGVPIINSTAAGASHDYQDPGHEHYEHLPIDVQAVGDPDAFAVTIRGDSMLPDFQEGDVCVFAPAALAEDGDACFIQFNEARDEGNMVKRVYMLSGNRIEMRPSNTRKYRPEVDRYVDDGGAIVRIVKMVGRYERYPWKRRPVE